MKKRVYILYVMSMIVSAAVAGSVTSDTAAFWDFENSTESGAAPYEGQPFNSYSATAGTYGTEDAVSGILMRGYNPYSGTYFTAQDVSSGFAMGCDAHNDGYVDDASFMAFAPEQWTIEATVRLDELDGWETFIGKNGSFNGNAQADFYFQKRGDGSGAFSCLFYTASGEAALVQSSTVMEADRWYGIATASDGTNAYLYIDSGYGYQLEDTYTFSNGGSDVGVNALVGDSSEWVFGRGWYNGNATDHIDGRIDNVRFSSACLTPAEFIGQAFRFITRTPLGTAGNMPVINAAWVEGDAVFSSAVLYLDGTAVATAGTREGETNSISYAVAEPLSNGSHDCEVIITDTAANTYSSDWSFTVQEGLVDGQFVLEPAGPCTRKTGFVISEIMHTPDDADGANTEFVEIYNSNPFEEELSGSRLSGEIDFTFPDGTFLAGQAYLIVAKDASAFQSRYNLSGVTVYEYGEADGGNSLGKSGLLRLRNNCDAIILEVDYDNDAPWPMGAEDTGHSLVLARPSYGENNPQAWSVSDVSGGSPGTADSYSGAALRRVCINEILAHTDDPQLDTIELYNHSNASVDLSGCILSDDPSTNRFVIPDGTVIPARGYVIFDQSQLGFSLNAAGETIFFRDSTATRMLDAVQFDGQENGVSIGRFPDGGKEFHRMAFLTLGGANAARLIDDVVINEIMYDPVSDDKDDEFVELYNQGSSSVDLSGWELDGGIDFTFPEGAVIPAGGYVVVAHDAAKLQTNYAQLNSVNTFGNYDGSLGNGGDRIILSKPDSVVDYEIPEHPTTNWIQIAVDDFTYKTGGQWPVWANGGGSSMERVDPRANPRLPTAWADSDETEKADWTEISVSGLLELGGGTAYAIEGGLRGAGECLLDDVQVVYSGANRVVNSDFDGGMDNWVARGTYSRSGLEADSGYGGTQCLHVRATKRYDSAGNRLMGDLSVNLSSGNTATISAKARWLKGDPHMLLRIHGNWLEAPAVLDVPSNLGTPGLVNSRVAANAAPDIADVRHAPVMPGAGESVVVSARVEDPDGVSSVMLKYRADPATGYSSVAMNDSGSAGDIIAGDGIYSATIPGQSAGQLVAFKVEASDGSLNRVFPANALANYPRERECLVRFGDSTRSSSFGCYRMWFTDAAITDWETRLVLSNEPIEGTFVHNDCRVIYNFSARYTGSYWHQGWSSPLSDCGYSMEMPVDDKLLGTDNFNKLHAPGNDPFTDYTMQREQTVYWMARQMGLPWIYRRYVNVYINGVSRKSGWLMEDTQVPGDDFVESYWPNDSDGEVYKMSLWREGDDAESGSVSYTKYGDTQLVPYLNADGEIHPTRLRWTWDRRAYGKSGGLDNQSVLDLISAANSGTDWDEALLEVADIEQWMRTLAVRHAAGDWDSYGCGPNGQNMYSYKPENGRWQLINWDANLVLGGSAYVPGRPLFPVTADFCGDSTLTSIYNHPVFRRMYLRSLKELCNDVLQSDKYNPLLTSRYNAFVADGFSPRSPDSTFSQTDGTSNTYDGEGTGYFSGSLRDWISEARSVILAKVAQENASDFALTSSSSLSVSSNLVEISGTAPVEMASILVNGVEYPIEWSTVTEWTIHVVVDSSGELDIQGFDLDGNELSGFNASVAVELTGPVDAPEDSVVINEILYNASEPDGEFVELYNRSTNTAFNLYDWRFNGLSHTFDSTVLLPGEYLVVDDFDGKLDLDGETLTLLCPAGTNGEETVVDQVRYETVDPWPATPAGSSLQLMDVAQDNRRAALWSMVEDAAVPPEGETIIDWGAAWKYSQGVNLDDTGWNLPAYDDSAWLEGPGALGVETTPAALPHPLQTDLTHGYLTYYFRKTFTFAGQGGAALQLTTMVDDGLVVYLDGEEVHRLRINGIPTYSSTTSTYVDNAYEEYSLVLPVNLQPGTHVLAVEVHQTSSSSSDIVFDMRVDTDYSDYSNIIATPGSANSVGYANPEIPAIWLNEVLPDPSSGLPWIELYNSGDSSIDVSGYYLSNDYDTPDKWSIPDGTTIASDEFISLSVPALTNGGSVLLSRDVADGIEMIDYLNYGDLSVGWSYGNWPDGDPCSRIAMYAASPGAFNSNESAPLNVRINEWMADNSYTLADSMDGKYDDWFELYNPDDEAVDIGGYFLTDDLEDPFQFEIPTGGKYTIPAHGFLLVWADNDTEQNELDTSALHVNFALSKSGETIAVTASDGTIIDSVSFGVQTNDVSEGSIPDGGSQVVVMSPATPGSANQSANSAPELESIADVYCYPGETVSFTAVASDAESAYQTLTFSLDSGAPAGATVSANGNFFWTVPAAFSPISIDATIRVTDDGNPVLSDTETFTLNVCAVPAFESVLSLSGNALSFGFDTLEDHTYQLQYKDSLINPGWLPTGTAVFGDGAWMEWVAPTTNAPVRFYRLYIETP